MGVREHFESDHVLQYFSGEFFGKNVAFTKFLPNKCESKFSLFPLSVPVRHCRSTSNFSVKMKLGLVYEIH